MWSALLHMATINYLFADSWHDYIRSVKFRAADLLRFSSHIYVLSGQCA